MRDHDIYAVAVLHPQLGGRLPFLDARAVKQKLDAGRVQRLLLAVHGEDLRGGRGWVSGGQQAATAGTA